VINSVLVAIAMMALFFAGSPVAEVAIVGGALLLFTRLMQMPNYRLSDYCSHPPCTR
jgi:hypothetical protein